MTNAEAVRRAWMTLLGCHISEINEACSGELNLKDELLQLIAVYSLL